LQGRFVKKCRRSTVKSGLEGRQSVFGKTQGLKERRNVVNSAVNPNSSPMNSSVCNHSVVWVNLSKLEPFRSASSSLPRSPTISEHAMTTTDLIESVYHAPNPALIVQSVQQRLKTEAEKRREYYALVHEDMKAEFINGDIVYQSPVRMRHWDVSTILVTYINSHVMKHKLGKVGVEKVMISLTRNDYEPDICFFSAERAAEFTPDQMHFPAPDFVVEIVSKSTESIDRGIKFMDYAAHGVREYWILDPNKETLEQYCLTANDDDEAAFELHQKLTKRGVCTSLVIHNFTIELADLFA
jgi:Uma2 family endonuclease